MSIEEQSRSLIERGYAIFERAYDDAEVEVFGRALDELHAEHGSPACYSPTPRPVGPLAQLAVTGLVVAKLIERRPGLAPRLLKAQVVEALRGALGQGMRLELTAAVIADASRPPFPWHTHIGGQDDTGYKTSGLWPAFERPRRIGTLLYLDDLTDDNGPLVLYPRAITDPTSPPYDPGVPSWQGELVVRVPRGTLVAMDECTWHTARPKTSPGLRRIVGCNFVSADAPPSPLVEASLAQQAGGELFGSVVG